MMDHLAQKPNDAPIGPKLGMAPMSTSAQLGLAKAFMAVSNFDQKPCWDAKPCKQYSQ